MERSGQSPHSPSEDTKKNWTSKLLKRLATALILPLLAAAQAGVAHGDVVHAVRFEAAPKVIVWGGSEAAIAASVNLDSAAARPAAMSDTIVTGMLEPVGLDTAPATPAELMGKSFYVASNSGFTVQARTEGYVSEAARNLAFCMNVALAGSNAQAPNEGGLEAGMDASVTKLGDIAAQRTVYQATRRTAARPGTIASQSVRFDAEWETLATGGTPDVTITVFAP